MPPAAHGENEPFVPPSPRGTRAPAREAPRGQRASFPAAPPSRGPGPGAWQAGSTPTIGAKPGNWSKGREGPDRATAGRGAPWGARASGWLRGAVPELAGAAGFSRVSDGHSDPRQPALCLLDHGSLGPLQRWLVHGHSLQAVSALPPPHLAKLLLTF